MKKLIILQFFFILLFSCNDSTNQVASADNLKQIDSLLEAKYFDSLELFFQSKGVLVLISTDENLTQALKIFNEDNTIYASMKFANNELIINGKEFKLNEFANNMSDRNDSRFFPKEFYPDQSVIQFEYYEIKDSIAEIFLDKPKNLIKRINLNSNLFKVQTWREHLIGTMIGFNEKTNPIRKNNHELAESTGYENSNKKFIFSIQEISGDWIKIECAKICNTSCNSNKKYDGWIKWKDKDKMIIRLLYSC